MKVKKAVIPAAGLGTRMLPATKSQPKEMLPIYDRPTLQYIVEEAVDSGIQDILIVTGRNKVSIEDHFDRSIEMELELEASGKEEELALVRHISNMANIHYVRQKQPLGLGHAILCAKSFVGKEPFAVLLGDDIVHTEKVPCLKQLINCYDHHKATILGVQEVPREVVNKYGIVSGVALSERLYEVEDLVEKPSIEEAPSRIAILGRYIIEPEIFEILEKTPRGVGNEIQLTDALKTLVKTRPMLAYVFEGTRYDVGNKLGFVKATIEFALRDESIQGDLRRYLKDLL